jgi:hypothetical protein
LTTPRTRRPYAATGVPVLRSVSSVRALLTRVRGDDVGYRDLASRYRAMAESLGFEGHIAWAGAMIEGGE